MPHPKEHANSNWPPVLDMEEKLDAINKLHIKETYQSPEKRQFPIPHAPSATPNEPLERAASTTVGEAVQTGAPFSMQRAAPQTAVPSSSCSSTSNAVPKVLDVQSPPRSRGTDSEYGSSEAHNLPSSPPYLPPPCMLPSEHALHGTKSDGSVGGMGNKTSPGLKYMSDGGGGSVKERRARVEELINRSKQLAQDTSAALSRDHLLCNSGRVHRSVSSDSAQPLSARWAQSGVSQSSVVSQSSAVSRSGVSGMGERQLSGSSQSSATQADTSSPKATSTDAIWSNTSVTQASKSSSPSPPRNISNTTWQEGAETVPVTDVARMPLESPLVRYEDGGKSAQRQLELHTTPTIAMHTIVNRGQQLQGCIVSPHPSTGTQGVPPHRQLSLLAIPLVTQSQAPASSVVMPTEQSGADSAHRALSTSVPATTRATSMSSKVTLLSKKAQPMPLKSPSVKNIDELRARHARFKGQEVIPPAPIVDAATCCVAWNAAVSSLHTGPLQHTGGVSVGSEDGVQRRWASHPFGSDTRSSGHLEGDESFLTPQERSEVPTARQQSIASAISAATSQCRTQLQTLRESFDGTPMPPESIQLNIVARERVKAQRSAHPPQQPTSHEPSQHHSSHDVAHVPHDLATSHPPAQHPTSLVNHITSAMPSAVASTPSPSKSFFAPQVHVCVCLRARVPVHVHFVYVCQF